MEPSAGIMRKLIEIQGALKVEKTHWNDFGGYYSRSKEDILEAVKPLAHERGCAVKLDDDVIPIAEGWVYVKSTAQLIDSETGEVVTATSYAREPEAKKKLDSSQITGSAASYAGKRALGNLFALDDTADSDQIFVDETSINARKPYLGACVQCGAQYQFENDSQLLNSMCRCGCTEFRKL